MDVGADVKSWVQMREDATKLLCSFFSRLLQPGGALVLTVLSLRGAIKHAAGKSPIFFGASLQSKRFCDAENTIVKAENSRKQHMDYTEHFRQHIPCSLSTPSTLLGRDAQHSPFEARFRKVCHFRQNETLKRVRNFVNRAKLSSIPELHEAVKARTKRCVSIQDSLSVRAGRAEHRLHSLLGEHLVQHYSLQLKGLANKLHNDIVLPLTSMPFADLPFPLSDSFLNSTQSSELCGQTKKQRRCQSVQLSRDVARLAWRGRAGLHGTQRALDLDATDSSSDEEWGDEESGEMRSVSNSCEEGEQWCRWLGERARLASCWTWLQLRLSELNFQLQRVTELHQHLLSSKRGVVLAKSQPLTDQQIQRTLLRETTGLALTAGGMQELTSELDMEPCSPTRLLWNIERQSAQLSQMVNSLLAPLNTSPSSSPESKRNCSHCNGQPKRSINSRGSVPAVFLPTGSPCLEEVGLKKRCACRLKKRPSRADASCLSARTRPLLTCHKRRLFSMHQPSITQQGLQMPSCSKSDENTISRGHPALSLGSERCKPLPLHKAVSREDWFWQSPCLTAEVVTPSHSWTAAHSHSLLSRRQQLQAGSAVESHRYGDLSIRWANASQETARGDPKRALKRKHHLHSDLDGRSSSLTSSSDYSAEEPVALHSTHTQQRNPQFPVRSRNGASVFNINDIILPVSLTGSAKVEKPCYKDILTPRWRILRVAPLMREDNGDVEKAESVSDEVFAQRHRSYEDEEKHCWGSWGKYKGSTRRTSCMNLSDRDAPSNVGSQVHLLGGQSSRCCTTGASAEGSQDRREPCLSWEKRVFPLLKEEEDALRCSGDDDDDGRQHALLSEREAMETTFMDSSCENTFSSPCCSPIAPPAGRTVENGAKKSRLLNSDQRAAATA